MSIAELLQVSGDGALRVVCRRAHTRVDFRRNTVTKKFTKAPLARLQLAPTWGKKGVQLGSDRVSLLLCPLIRLPLGAHEREGRPEAFAELSDDRAQALGTSAL